MSVISITEKFQKVTVPSNTNEHQLSFADLVDSRSSFTALIKWVSGTAVQISNESIGSNSGTLSTANDKLVFKVNKNIELNFKGGAGAEVFTVNIC